MSTDIKHSVNRRAFLSTSVTIGAGLAVSVLSPPILAHAKVFPQRYSGNIIKMSALELSAAIKGRALSCVEVMTAYLAHIDHHNPAVNAIISRPDRHNNRGSV